MAPAACAAVVKADAYGLGAEQIIPALADAGCRHFFVATLNEAEQARRLAPQTDIFVLDGILPNSAEAMKAAGAIPVLSTLEDARAWSRMATEPNERVPCILHVDTGLNRLGLTAAEIRHLANDIHLMNALDVRIVMSHLACADEPDHPKNQQQLSVLHALRPILPTVDLSLAASDGLMLGPDYHFQMVRPGYALYGGQASPQRTAPVKPAVSVYARVLQVRDVAPSQTVGYSATFEPERTSRIAVIAAGYDDGVFRHLSGETGTVRGNVAFAGRLAPIVGRVSMDLITVDVTDFEEQPVARDHWAELIGPTLSIESVGAAAGSIGYEVLTRLGRRFHRVYTP